MGQYLSNSPDSQVLDSAPSWVGCESADKDFPSLSLICPTSRLLY